MKFEFNWEMKWKIDGEDIENLLVNRCWKNKIKSIHAKKHFSCFFTWKWIKQILYWNHLIDNNDAWNLKLFYLNKVTRIKYSYILIA
jgi:hypothetical protein